MKSVLLKNHSYVLKEIQIMLKDERQRSGWVTCVIAARWVQAKVYDEGSQFGINGGRVSKLIVSKDMMKPKVFTKEGLDFSYDRGADYSNLPEKDVAVIVAALEKLPPAAEGAVL